MESSLQAEGGRLRVTAKLIRVRDQEEAVFEWLDKAYAARDVHLIYLTVDPKWDAYRSDARFGALLVRCGFAQKS